MKPRNSAIAALFLLTTCNEAGQDRSSATVESSSQALGKTPPSEVATWRKVGGSTLPDGRYLQAVAFDETRRVAVMFGGLTTDTSTSNLSASQETWEWSLTTGEWTNRTATGTTPAARSGAAMAFDSQRNKIVLFGGRAGSGFNYQDTWEWDPTGGTWTDLTTSGSRPADAASTPWSMKNQPGRSCSSEADEATPAPTTTDSKRESSVGVHGHVHQAVPSIAVCDTGGIG